MALSPSWRRFAQQGVNAVRGPRMGGRKVVVIGGSGFLGKYVVQALISDPTTRIQIASRNPQKAQDSLSHLGTQLLPPASIDITSSSPTALEETLDGADAVVSLVGLLSGDLEKVQVRGAENVARAAKEAGVKVVHVSAIGADEGSPLGYFKTKALGEKAVLSSMPDATIIRPSLVFGPGDGFFTRFDKLSSMLPFLPVFGGGRARFAPVYAGDVGRAVEVSTRLEPEVKCLVGGKVVEACGPDVYTYKQLMEQILRYSGRTRPIISLPFALGKAQGAVMEMLPENLFTLTRDQVEQLKMDSTPSSPMPEDHLHIATLLSRFQRPGLTAVPAQSSLSDDPLSSLTPLSSVLRTYIGSGRSGPVNGKRMHGRAGEGMDEMFAEVQRMTEEAKRVSDAKRGRGGAR